MKLQDRYDSLVGFYAEKYGNDFAISKRQMLAESSANPDAESSEGAKGLFQFMDATFIEWSQRLRLIHADPLNPEHSIACGMAYMQWLKDQVNDDVRLALAAYNFGIGHIKRGDPWPQETIDYVNKILGTGAI